MSSYSGKATLEQESSRRGSVWIRRVFWCAFILVLIQGVRFLAFPPGWLSPVRIEVEVRLEDENERKDEVYLQVYQDTGSGLSEEQSRRIAVPGTGQFEQVQMFLPYTQWEDMRFDGPARPGLFSIRSVRLVSDREVLEWEGEKVAEVLIPAAQIAVIGNDALGGILYRSTGLDPQFTFAAPAPEPKVFGWKKIARWLVALTVTLGAIGIFFWGLSFVWSVTRSLRANQGPLSGYRIWVFGVVVLAVSGLYFLLGTQAERDPVPQHMAGHNLYFHLTEAFLHGQLSLLEEPVRPLRELENPFDPGTNEKLRLHDASYFEEKYYVYFGPAPVVSLYLPWKILTGTDLPDRWADGFFLTGAFVLLLLTFLKVREGVSEKLSIGQLLIAASGLGFTTGALYLMSRSVVYEVALGSALFWTAAAILLSVEGLQRRGTFSVLIATGISLGMAMASRHSFVLPSVFILGAFGCAILFSKKSLWEGVRKVTLAAFPAACIGVALLAHNYLRFGDPVEFGHNYQIGVIDPSSISFLDPANYLYNSVINLFQPPAFASDFPWVYPQWENLLSWVERPESHIRVEGALGFLVTNPYLLLIPLIVRRSSLRKLSSEGWWVLISVVGIAMINFSVIACFSYSAPRYAVDYLPWLVLAFFLLWSMRDRDACRTTVQRVGKRLMEGFFVVTFLWSVSVHFGLALHRVL
ncbi:MAG: hypothetical protein AAGJ81_02635 [Verrucomicrobiota bacterium]